MSSCRTKVALFSYLTRSECSLREYKEQTQRLLHQIGLMRCFHQETLFLDKSVYTLARIFEMGRHTVAAMKTSFFSKCNEGSCALKESGSEQLYDDVEACLHFLLEDSVNSIKEKLAELKHILKEHYEILDKQGQNDFQKQEKYQPMALEQITIKLHLSLIGKAIQNITFQLVRAYVNDSDILIDFMESWI